MYCVEFFMIIMAIWIVPMSYGHVANAPMTDLAEVPSNNGGADGVDPTWYDARATFFGDMRGETRQGACGYDASKQGYGLATGALSTALFNNGYTCGACYEIKCVNDPQLCLPGSIKITATNFCPPDFPKCTPPQKHFDLSKPMFIKIAKEKAEVISVQYKRVPCAKTGGVKFETKGNPNLLTILPFNVGGAGDIKTVQVKGTKTGWISMMKIWGQQWTTKVVLTGQSVSFRVTTSDGISKDFINVMPSNWGFGQTFDGGINF